MTKNDLKSSIVPYSKTKTVMYFANVRMHNTIYAYVTKLIQTNGQFFSIFLSPFRILFSLILVRIPTGKINQERSDIVVGENQEL